MFASVEELESRLASQRYLADRPLATTVYLACRLRKPLLVEGPAGVGKTELAKVLAAATGSRLVRLQCYEGLDEAKSLYEWNYQKQLLRIQANHLSDKSWEEMKEDIFTFDFLFARPLLTALLSEEPVVLLIDEVDKSDEEFESFLLEALSDFQVTIPELGTVKAARIPLVVLTSNSFREFSDALKRRCIHLFIGYPDYDRELAIINMKVPGIGEALARQLVEFVQAVRKQKLRKAPSIAESLDWAQSLVMLGVGGLNEDTVTSTLTVLLKYQSDVEKVQAKIKSLLPG